MIYQKWRSWFPFLMSNQGFKNIPELLNFSITEGLNLKKTMLFLAGKSMSNQGRAPGYRGNGKPVLDCSVPSTMTSRNENGNPIPILSASNFAISLAPRQ